MAVLCGPAIFPGKNMAAFTLPALVLPRDLNPCLWNDWHLQLQISVSGFLSSELYSMSCLRKDAAVCQYAGAPCVGEVWDDVSDLAMASPLLLHTLICA